MLRKLRALSPITGILVAVVIGLVIVQLASGNQPPPAPPKDQFTPEPLSPEEVARLEEQHRQQWANSQQPSPWLAEFELSGIDPRTLETVDLLVEPAPPPVSLDDAVDRSSIVGVATVVNVAYRNYEVVLTLRIDSSSKNESAASEVVVPVGGGPRPADGDFTNFDPDHVVLAESPAWPIPFLNDRLFVFLQRVEVLPGAPNPEWQDRYGVDQIYGSLTYVGFNPIAGGRLSSNPLLSFGSELNELTEEEAISRTAALKDN